MRYRVEIIESEYGWGQHVEEIKYFDTLEEAKDYQIEFNAMNDETEVPDWYMYATDPKEDIE